MQVLYNKQNLLAVKTTKKISFENNGRNFSLREA